MTPRENLLKVFRHETPEWIPIVGHVDPYNQPSREGMDPDLAEALGEVQWRSEATVVFSRYLGIDIMDYIGAPIQTTRRNVTIDQQTEGDTTTRIWHTPAGDLREVSQICRDWTGAVSSNHLEHMLKTPADIPAVAAIFEDEQIELNKPELDFICARKRMIGDDGMLMSFMAGTPLGMMYRVYSGVENLAYLWADARDALHDLFRVMEDNYLRQYRIAAQSDVDILVGMDDTSTTAISPAMFAEFNLALTDERCRVAHAADKLYFHHSCGLIHDLLSLYRRTDIDAVHAFTIPPIGNVTVAQGRQLLGGRITIFAGLGQLCGSMNDRDAVKTDIQQMIREAEPWDHFVLGLAAYPNRTIEQTQFVVDCCRELQSI